MNHALAVYAALTTFADTFGDGRLAYDAGPNLTCTEVEALAGLFEVLGLQNTADTWRRSHAVADNDEGDLHNTDGQWIGGTVRDGVRVGRFLHNTDGTVRDGVRVGRHSV